MRESGNGITVEQLAKQFKKGPLAVDGIDLEVAPGEIYGFLGPNGAGKSTTVHMLTTLLPPTSGTGTVAGFDIVKQGPDVRDQIGVALQEAALDQFLTAREHMRLQAGMHGIPKAEALRRGDELIERVGLSDAADRKVGGYSGGMRRRLDLALALVHSPRVLFLDEPTTGLDVQSRTALWDEVARLSADDGVTVFLTTQYLEEADSLADRVGIIDTGKIVAEGTPDALKAEIGRPTVEAAPRDEAELERMREVLARFGAPQRPTAVASPCASTRAAPSSPMSSARSTPRGSPSRTSRSTPRASTMSSSPRPAAASRAPRSRPSTPSRARVSWRRFPRERRRCRTARRGGWPRPHRDPDPGRLPGATVDHAHDPPADDDRPEPDLPAVPARRELERARGGDPHPGLPHRLLPQLRDRPDLHAGRTVRHHGRRPVDRPGHPARLLQPAAAHAAARPAR